MVCLSSLPSYFPQLTQEYLIEFHEYLCCCIERRSQPSDDEWRNRSNIERRLMYQRQRAALERLACPDVEIKRALVPLIIDFDRPGKFAYFMHAAIISDADYKGFHASIRKSQELLAKADLLSRQLDRVMYEIAECALGWERYGDYAPYRLSRIKHVDRTNRIKQDFEDAIEGERALIARARQVSTKASYLRVFAYRLTRCDEARDFCRRWGFRYWNTPIVLKPSVYRGMSSIANVILNDPEISVSYDDAKKAIDLDMLASLQSDEDEARLERWLRRFASN